MVKITHNEEDGSRKIYVLLSKEYEPGTTVDQILDDLPNTYNLEKIKVGYNFYEDDNVES